MLILNRNNMAVLTLLVNTDGNLHLYPNIYDQIGLYGDLVAQAAIPDSGPEDDPSPTKPWFVLVEEGLATYYHLVYHKDAINEKSAIELLKEAYGELRMKRAVTDITDELDRQLQSISLSNQL